MKFHAKDIMKANIMKKIVIMLTVLSVVVFVGGCGNKEDDKSSDGKNASENKITREVIPAYEKIGSENTIATSDGRYFYYTYFDTTTDEGKLCRMDMNGENQEELLSTENQKFYSLHIADGYLFFKYRGNIYRIDIATAPDFFDCKNGVFSDKAILAEEDYWVECIKSDDEYIYYLSANLYRINKETLEIECIAEGNFKEYSMTDNYLYAYNSDEYAYYRMNKDGSNKEKMFDSGKWIMMYCDRAYYGDCYYTDGIATLYEINLDTGEKNSNITLWNNEKDLASPSVSNIIENKIYYYYYDKGKSSTIINSCDLLTSTISEHCELYDFSYGEIAVVGNFIFYENNGGILMKINLDGTGLEQLGR